MDCPECGSSRCSSCGMVRQGKHPVSFTCMSCGFASKSTGSCKECGGKRWKV